MTIIEVERLLVEQRRHGVLAILRGAADRVEGAEADGELGRRRSDRASRARNISPISSDSELSIVVWFAQPIRCEIAIRIEAGRDRRARSGRETRRDQRPPRM